MTKINFIVEHDDTVDSPREWDNLGTMVCAHGRYVLGDEQVEPSDHEGWVGLKRNLIRDEKAVVILPLYLYDHSGLSLYTKGDGRYRQHEAWDSGQVGYIYVSEDTLREEYGRVTEETLEKAEKILRSEIEAYDAFLRGDVYAVSAETESGEFIDAVSGLYGDDEVELFKQTVLNEHSTSQV